MSEENNKTPLEQIMSQAQVFASAWALVDGPFGGPHSMQDARTEKADLEDMLEDLIERHTEQVDGMAGAIQKLIEWHAHKVEQLEAVNSGARKGTSLEIGGEAIELTADMAKGMRIALAIALDFLGKLPITLSRG